MTRPQNDDSLYGDLQHQWNYRPDGVDMCVSNNISNRPQQTVSSNACTINENNFFGSPNSFLKTEPGVMIKNTFSVNNENAVNNENIPFPNVARVNNLQNYGAHNVGNGQLVRVYYDENNRPFMIPVTGQYECYNNPGVREQATPHTPSTIFNTNQEYVANCNNIHPSVLTNPIQKSNCSDENLNMHNSSIPTSNFLNELLGNWMPNSTGTYSPFGQNHPLNHPDAPAMNIHHNNSPLMDTMNTSAIHKPEFNPPKRNENSPLADTSNKKRIVAEVKPMRPTYSDVLAKNSKNNAQADLTRKANTFLYSDLNKTKPNNKMEEQLANNKQSSAEKKIKNEKKAQTSTISSGSESGEVPVEEKHTIPMKKNRSKRNNMSHKWSSFEDLHSEHVNSSENSSSQFIFIENQSEKKKEKKSHETSKQSDKTVTEDDFNIDEDSCSQFVLQEGQTESAKTKRKKETRNYGYKSGKSSQEKKKTQVKWKRNKPGYFGLVQNYMEHWWGVTWKAILWFFYLLSDICRMSAHLSFDL